MILALRYRVEDESRADASQVSEGMVLFHENESKRSLNGKTDLLLLFPSFSWLGTSRRMVLFHENESKRSLNGKTDLLLLFPSFNWLGTSRSRRFAALAR